jgi:hypothetical protein
MTAIDITTLEASVEALIRQQVAAYEAQLRETLVRKLARALKASPGQRTTRSTASRKRRASLAPRRSPEELKALGERFLSAVEATPGETMVTLAAGLGLRVKELERPVLRLKRESRIKTVGERNRTRYYALTPRSA